MIYAIEDVSKIIEQMDNQLRDSLLIREGEIQRKKLWEHTHIKKQIDRRKNGTKNFPIQEHIRAMVYSMLSSGISWERIEKSIDEKSGRISVIDDIFHQYDPEQLLVCSADELTEQIKEIKCTSQSTRKQIDSLVHTNINKMVLIEKEYGSIDQYYQKFIEIDATMKLLIKNLSDLQSKDKYVQMAEPLNAEYLRNVGYDIAKPDRHICRILGSNYLGCSDNVVVPVYEAFDIVKKIADNMKKSVAEVDYILWSYCANGYGEICTVLRPKCEICVAKEICKKKG